MKQLSAGALVAAASILLAACGGSSSSSPGEPPAAPAPPPPPPPPALVQVVHASADAPAVDIAVNGAVPEPLAGVPFAAASPYLELPPGDISAAVNALLPDGSSVEVLGVPALPLESAVAYTVIAAGSTATFLGNAEADGALDLFLLTRPVLASIDGVRIQVLHGSPSAPAVDVYVTAPDASLEGVEPATFAFGEVLDLGTVPAADYRIRITPADAVTVVFDSGPVALPAGADLSIIAVDNTGPGASPVALLAVFADGSVAELRDGGAAAPAGLTAVHNAVDAPAVCVVAFDADATTPERIELFAGVPFRAFGYLGEIPPGNYQVGLEVFEGGACSGTAAVTFEAPVGFAAGDELTGIVVGRLGDGSLDLLGLPDDLRPIATEARVRIVHGSSATPEVDIYVVPAGADISDPAITPAFSDVPFRASTGFVSLPAGEYDVFVTLAGGTAPAIAVTGLALGGGEVLTAIASDPAGEETAPGLIVIDHVDLKSPAL